jgi:hypothetical protein
MEDSYDLINGDWQWWAAWLYDFMWRNFNWQAKIHKIEQIDAVKGLPTGLDPLNWKIKKRKS